MEDEGIENWDRNDEGCGRGFPSTNTNKPPTGGTKTGATRGGEGNGDEADGCQDPTEGGKRGDTNGDGTRDRSDREIPSQQTRLISYVVPPTGNLRDEEVLRDVLEEDDWQGHGKLGVERVAQEEEKQRLGREVKIVQPGDAGYNNPALLSLSIVVVVIGRIKRGQGRAEFAAGVKGHVDDRRNR